MVTAMVEPAAADLVLRIPSPAFTTHPPDVRNPGLVPAAVKDAMAYAWGSRHYGARDVTVRRMRDVYVVGEGLVFDRNGVVVRPSITQHSPAEVDAAAVQVQAAMAENLAVVSGVTLLCAKRGAANYGHWLYEMLPVAALGLERLQAAEWRALIPQAEGQLAAVFHASLALLGVPLGQVAMMGLAPQRFEELLIVEGLTAHGRYVSPLVTECLASLAARVTPGNAPFLWVSRAGDSRSLWNEAEICAVLQGSGWNICRPGTMSFVQQVALFKGARHIAGVGGAGLVNLVFAASGARITNFMPAAMPDTLFWLLAELCGHEYVEVRSPHPDKIVGLNAWDSSLVLTLPDVLAYLA